MRAFISFGSIQLLVGPASFSSTEQMKVRSSTRATSVGSEAAQNELGFFSSLRRTKVPVSTSESVSSTHSSSDPVHQWTLSGWVSFATSLTQSRMPWWVVGALSWISLLVDAVSAVMAYHSLSRVRYAESRIRPSSLSMVEWWSCLLLDRRVVATIFRGAQHAPME